MKKIFVFAIVWLLTTIIDFMIITTIIQHKNDAFIVTLYGTFLIGTICCQIESTKILKS